MSRIFEGNMSADGLHFGVVVTRWNDLIVERLLTGARSALRRHGASEKSVDVAYAPGAYEVPFVAKTMAATGRYDAIVTLGCVIRGATPHFDYVAGEASSGVAAAMRETNVPMSFGVLTVDSIEQALERAGTKAGNKGEEAALAALELVNLKRSIDANDPGAVQS